MLREVWDLSDQCCEEGLCCDRRVVYICELYVSLDRILMRYINNIDSGIILTYSLFRSCFIYFQVQISLDTRSPPVALASVRSIMHTKVQMTYDASSRFKVTPPLPLFDINVGLSRSNVALSHEFHERSPLGEFCTLGAS